MNERKTSPLYGIGGVTLLTVLLVLCLTLFAVLALSSAQADYRLSEKNARTVKAYYAAENEAYYLMSLAEAVWPAGDRTPPLSAFVEALPAEADASVEAQADGVLLSADIPVQEGSYLRISASLKGGPNAARWTISQWQLLPPIQDEGDIPSLALWIP